ncbi:MAG: hypothetical protein MHM6MM_001204 [Cercozoa sp. M6MM]
MTTSSAPRQVKLVLLGDTAVGKTSLVMRFAKDVWFEYQESTIGAAYMPHTIQVDGTPIKFEIWDTAGQERYHALAPMYYRGAGAAVMVYDITSAYSFRRAQQWVHELRSQVSDCVVALAGNKCDLADHREVETEDAKSFAEEHDLVFQETSAKADIHVGELFEQLGRRLLEQERQRTQEEEERRKREQKNSGTVRIDNTNKSSGGCC